MPLPFREILGGIARNLMRAGRVKPFYISDTYMIPKEYVIEYVLGEYYAEYRYALKAQI